MNSDEMRKRLLAEYSAAWVDYWKPVKRVPVAPWTRSPGGQNCTTGFNWTTRQWDDESHYRGSHAMYTRPAPDGGPGNVAVCEACAERAGVFADRPTLPAPASKPAIVEARAAIAKPCPACNGQPFETRRCPRCHMPPKSEPVRVKIRAVGAYNDRGPVDRKWGSMVPDSPKRWLAAQTGIATGLHLENPRQPAARVGTVPQSLGAGIGIWASRGMRR